MDNEIIVGLDIGTTKIACFVGMRTENRKVKILGFGKTESVGVENGVVKSITGTADSITIPEGTHATPEPAPAANAPRVTEPDYVLRSADGELCVFQGSRLLHRTGVYTRTLPREDQAHLEKGISADSQEALASLLEDLCS
jgi:hypothetical protein